MTQSDRRNNRIDTLRGLACFLLVLFHVVGNNSSSGLQLDRAHGLVLFNEVLGYLRMPLFSVLSGYVYACRPFRQEAGAFMLGKARRLLIPMLVVGTAFALLQASVAGSNSQVTDWHLLHIMPVAHYWFLESLFVIFMVILALEHVAALATTPRLMLVFGVAAAMFATEPLPVYFGLAGAVYLFPFVLFGLWCGRFSGTAKEEQLMHLQLGVTFALTACLHAVVVTQALPDTHSLTALVMGCGVCMILLKSGIESNFLATIGRYSFAIFLFHTMASAGSRIVLTKMGLASLYVTVPAGLLVGIAVPVLAARWLKDAPLWAQWVLGEAAPKRALKTSPIARASRWRWLPGYSAQQKRIQMRLARARAEMVLAEFVHSVHSKQAKDTMF
jgi:peptidoglycan/LPS O-acetylase OafA/YrhL